MSAETPTPAYAPAAAPARAAAHASTMRVTLHVWRQKDRDDPGRMVAYPNVEASPDMSFLELLDVLNEQLIARGEEPIAFDSDCREGICGACSLTIDGIPHGPRKGTTVCQLHMRTYQDGAQIFVEPWRAAAFPVVKDLVVDRSAFDRIISAGGFVSVRTGGCPDGNAIPVPKTEADAAMDAAACIGCGACVAACPNAAERHGSSQSSAPSWNSRKCSWHTVVARRGPCATPSIMKPQVPQIPSRQSLSKAIGGSPLAIRRSLSTSSSSRNDMCSFTSRAS